MNRTMKMVGILAGAAVLFATPSCKKGENDPGLTFKSRKGRIAGTWNVTSKMEDYSWEDNTGFTRSVDFDYSGTQGIELSVDINGYSTERTYTYSEYTLTFTKEGTFEEKYTRSLTQLDFKFNDPQFTDPGPVTDPFNLDGGIDNEVTRSGTWAFLSAEKNSDYKNKERIVLNVMDEETITPTQFFNGTTVDWATNTETRTYGNGEMSMVVDLDMLKSKEMTMKSDHSSSWDFSSTDPNSFDLGDDEETSMTMSLEKQD